MLWTPVLPDHCTPANDFLLRFSSTFHVCIPSESAFISNILGVLSIAAWLSAQLPQIWKNYNLKSTSGLSLYFLIEWCLGDLGNLLGAVFTHQAPWQVTIGAYYVFVDFCLVLQWLWYERLKHGRPLFHVRNDGARQSPDREDMHQVHSDPSPPVEEPPKPRAKTHPRPIFRTPTFEQRESNEVEKELATPRGTRVYRMKASSSFPSPSPKTVLLIACLFAVAQALPITAPLVTSMQSEHGSKTQHTPLENAGTILSWMSTVLYIGSRFPQILKNWSRKSTSGLSAHLFVAAFCGNLLYSAAIVTNPNAWDDFEPYGGGGWAGPAGSDREEWIAGALPFFLGAAGVLVLDATVGMQFVLYSEEPSKVIVVQDSAGKKWRWRRVSGWMRGWIPSVRESDSVEGRRLLEHDDTVHDTYGTLERS